VVEGNGGGRQLRLKPTKDSPPFVFPERGERANGQQEILGSKEGTIVRGEARILTIGAGPGNPSSLCERSSYGKE